MQESRALVTVPKLVTCFDMQERGGGGIKLEKPKRNRNTTIGVAINTLVQSNLY
jgi:hypothetical protein